MAFFALIPGSFIVQQSIYLSISGKRPLPDKCKFEGINENDTILMHAIIHILWISYANLSSDYVSYYGITSSVSCTCFKYSAKYQLLKGGQNDSKEFIDIWSGQLRVTKLAAVLLVGLPSWFSIGIAWSQQVGLTFTPRIRMALINVSKIFIIN